MTLNTTDIVEAAMGADLTADPSTWAWTDLSARARGSVQVTRGKTGENALAQPTDVELRLDNLDGALTPHNPNSAYYELWRRGTPVRVRRRLELGTAYSDTFTRTVSNGWGSADTGQSYTVSAGGGASEFSTTGSLGRQTLVSANDLHLAFASAGAKDVTVQASVTVPVVPTGASIIPRVVARLTDASNYYDAELVIDNTGLVQLQIFRRVAGVLAAVSGPFVVGVHSAGNTWIVRFSVNGPQLQAMAWKSTGAQPVLYQVSGTDTSLTTGSSIGLSSRRETGNTNTSPAIDFDNLTVTGPERVYQGNVFSVQTVFPRGDSKLAEVNVSVKGALSRLAQGTAIPSALYRTITTATPGPGPTAYWPLEDGANATQAASGLVAGAPMTVTSAVRFGSDAGPAGSGELPDFSSGGSLAAAITAVSSSSWRLEFAFRCGSVTVGTTAPILQVFTKGTVSWWEIDVSNIADGGLTLQWIKSGVFAEQALNLTADDDEWHWVTMEVATSGANLSFNMFFDDAGASGSISTATIGAPIGVVVNPPGGTASVSSIGHVTVWTPFAAGINTLSAFRGYAGESPSTRIGRLGLENDLPVQVFGGVEPIGAQSVAKLVDLLREVEAADGGILTDGQHAGVTYLGRDQRANLPVSLALDCNSKHVKLGFAPVDDDQMTTTSATVTRLNGSSDQYVDTTSRAAYGDYPISVTQNVASDIVLGDHAAWLVHLGTVPEMRVPAITLNLSHTTDLVPAWLGMDIGDRVTVSNLPLTQYPPGGLDLVLEQYVEQYQGDRGIWTVTLLCSPFRPWRIATAGPTVGTAGAEFQFRAGPVASTLNASLTTSATSVAVATSSGPLWTTSVGSTPLYIDLEGEQVQVTAISGSSSPQTFTLTRSVNSVVKAHASGVSVKLWHPTVPAL